MDPTHENGSCAAETVYKFPESLMPNIQVIESEAVIETQLKSLKLKSLKLKPFAETKQLSTADRGSETRRDVRHIRWRCPADRGRGTEISDVQKCR